MKERYKYIILVLSVGGKYEDIINAIKDTWAKDKYEDTLILFYYGGGNNSITHLDGVNLMCADDEGIRNIGRKTLTTFGYILDHYDFDCIIRCCAGSYIEVKNLLKHLDGKVHDNFYSGIEGNVDGISYASGSCYFLSRNLVEKVYQNKEKWNHRLIDDMALGNLLSELGVKTDGASAQRVNFHDEDDLHQHLKPFRDQVDETKTRCENFMDNYHFHFLNNPKRTREIHRYFQTIYSIDDEYRRCVKTRSDINEHLPVIFKIASECDNIVELGVRSGISTWAMLRAYPKKMTCIDISLEAFEENRKKIVDIVNDSDIDFESIEGNSLDIEIPNTDLLFIDTWHTYGQLSAELKKHSSKVQKYIIIHDTQTFGGRDMDNVYNSDIVNTSSKSGLNLAIKEFLQDNESWAEHLRFRNNNGMVVLKKL